MSFNGVPSESIPVEETVYAEFDQSANESQAGELQHPQAPPGSVLEVKRVDETYDALNGKWASRDRIIETGVRDGKDTYAAYAFTVNRRFQPKDNKGMHTVTTTLDIKSEHLREVGKTVIGQVQGISWTSKPLRVSLSRRLRE